MDRYPGLRASLSGRLLSPCPPGGRAARAQPLVGGTLDHILTLPAE